MADNSNNMNSNMCKSNCGFFGNASCDGFCSKCYKDHVKRQNSGSAAGRVTPTSMSVASSANSSSSMAAAATAAALTQMNSINEIPVNTKSSSFNNSITTSISEDDYPAEQQQSTQASHESGKMLPPLAPPPVSSSDAAITPNSNSSIASIGSAASKPIAIPGRAFSTNAANVAMSVPADLCSTSMTSTSPTDTNADDSLLGTSIESSSLNVISMSCSNAGEVKSKKRSRCVLDSCKRKVGLTGFDCRCGGLYCWEHRYSDKHNCQFDYKELGQDQIRKNNPIVVGEKIQKI